MKNGWSVSTFSWKVVSQNFAWFLNNVDKGTDEELVRFCFDTYDLNDDGYISREEMLLLLKDCMYKNSRETNEEDGDDGVKDLIEMTMRKMDQDRDGRVSYSDFWETVQEVLRWFPQGWGAEQMLF